ncbi:MAG: diadenylate cyclase CdaA [Spirosomataceae bacterium]
MFLFKISFLDIGFIDILDIILVAFLLYQVYHLIRGSIASRVFLGYLLVYVAYLLVKALGMELLSTILGQFMEVGVLALLIIFQPEIRRFLLLVGKSTSIQDSKWFRRFFPHHTSFENEKTIQEIADSARMMAATHTGALLVIQREDDLKKYIDSGDELDAVVSKRMISSIFFKNSPFHDGAVIIHEGRIKAARCMLPVTENPNIPATLGFRHRAAIGMSEATDAVIVVVSEEKGEITLVHTGGMFRSLTANELAQKLKQHLTT